MEGSIVIAKTVSKNINLDTAQCVVEQTRDRATLSVKTAIKDRKENGRIPVIEEIGNNKIVKIDGNWERKKIIVTKNGKKVVSMGTVKAEHSKKGLDDKMQRARKAKQQEMTTKKDEKDYA